MRPSLVFPPCRAKWFISLLALACLSCSRGVPLNPVQGKLLFNNEPVEGAVVTFHPKGGDITTVLPIGTTEEDGSFIVTTGQREGAATGEYVVTVICARIAARKGKPRISFGGQKDAAVDRFKGAYANKGTSKIKVTIKDGDNILEPFNLQ
jgi:hypothetical protein